MIINRIFLIFSILTYFISSAQKEISLEEIWGGKFRTERLQEIQHLNNSEEFSVYEYDRGKRETKIIAKKYTDNSQERVVISALDIPELDYFETYEFNYDESKVLLGLNYQSLYRYSASAEYYVYDFETKIIVQIGSKRIYNPTFSPDGNKVGYVFQNDLYIKDLTSEKITRVTTDGKKNEIINGMSDWVYEEEFELVSAFEWNTSSTHIAYLKFDESEVKEFQLPIYGEGNYPSSDSFKYPKAGEKNSIVTPYIFSLEKNKSTVIDLLKKDSDYIPRLKWTKDPKLLCIQVMNRNQSRLGFN